jgi:hypothetical protein
MCTTIATYKYSDLLLQHPKHMQHASETSKPLETYACNMWFQRNISILFGRMDARRRVQFTGVQLASSAEIVAPMEKATIGSVEKAATDFHAMRVERELCAR